MKILDASSFLYESSELARFPRMYVRPHSSSDRSYGSWAPPSKIIATPHHLFPQCTRCSHVLTSLLHICDGNFFVIKYNLGINTLQGTEKKNIWVEMSQRFCNSC